MNLICPLCGSQSVNGIFEKDRIPYYKCLDCTFVFSRPETNANLENRLEDYEKTYIDYLCEGPEDERNFDVLYTWISRFRPIERARLLDVGSGSGKFVRFLRERSVEAYGIEPAKALYDHFLAREDFFSNKLLEEFATALPLGRLDIVTAFDVVEHVERPRQFLESVSRLLYPGGLLFVSTPDVASVLAWVSGRKWHYYNKYHLSYLSRRTITATASCYGFRLVDFSRKYRLRSLGYILGYFVEFVLGSRGVRMPELLNAIPIPINLFDTMYLCFKKEIHNELNNLR